MARSFSHSWTQFLDAKAADEAQTYQTYQGQSPRRVGVVKGEQVCLRVLCIATVVFMSPLQSVQHLQCVGEGNCPELTCWALFRMEAHLNQIYYRSGQAKKDI